MSEDACTLMVSSDTFIYQELKKYIYLLDQQPAQVTPVQY